MLHIEQERRFLHNGPLRWSASRLFQPKGAVAEGAIALARSVGWIARIVGEERPRLDIEVDGVVLSFHDYGAPWDAPDDDVCPAQADEPQAMRKVPAPCEVAVDACLSAIGGASAHATILAPVGSYASPQQAGAIDSVIVSPGIHRKTRDGTPWTGDAITISHTRCWLLSLLVTPQRAIDPADLRQAMQASERLLLLPSWLNVTDSAALSEAMRDWGWPDARFPDVVVLSSAVIRQGAAAVAQVWLAATDACVCVALAEAIGTIAAPHLSPDERFLLLKRAWRRAWRSPQS